MKWYTFKEYEMADEETGEILRKGKMPNTHEVITKKIKTIIHENKGIKTITYWCERRKQLKLWDE